MSNVTAETTSSDIPELNNVQPEAPTMELKIASWLNEQAKKQGIHGLELKISNNAEPGARYRVTASAPSKPDSYYADESGYGGTVEAAVGELRKKINPARIAEQARKKAAELLAEAAKLEKQAAALAPVEA